jgi:hypothetical protein
MKRKNRSLMDYGEGNSLSHNDWNHSAMEVLLGSEEFRWGFWLE